MCAVASAPEGSWGGGVRVWQITSGNRRATWEATAACPGANVDWPLGEDRRIEPAERLCQLTGQIPVDDFDSATFGAVRSRGIRLDAQHKGAAELLKHQRAARRSSPHGKPSACPRPSPSTESSVYVGYPLSGDTDRQSS